MSVAMACRTALTPGLLGFLFGPPMGSAFLVSGTSALGGNLTLLVTVHHSEAPPCLGHDASIGL